MVGVVDCVVQLFVDLRQPKGTRQQMSTIKSSVVSCVAHYRQNRKSRQNPFVIASQINQRENKERETSKEDREGASLPTRIKLPDQLCRHVLVPSVLFFLKKKGSKSIGSIIIDKIDHELTKGMQEKERN